MARKYQIIIAGVIVAVAAVVSIRKDRHSVEPFHREPYATTPGDAASGPCVDFHQAASHAGENGCVTGYVLRAFTSKAGNTFLDFCPDYHNCPFSTVIFASDHAKFGQIDTLAGRHVEIYGFITIYQGKAEIIIHDPWQIRVAP
jgi:hypothetical protein